MGKDILLAGKIIAEAVARLTSVGIDNPRLDARVLLAHAMNISTNDLILGNIDASNEAKVKFEHAIVRRLTREPVAYIIGEKEFWSLPFAVGPGVLIPRPQTETLIEEAQRRFPSADTPLRILDLGTGSGILLLTLLHLYPNAQGTGVDASSDALRWAEANARKFGLESRAELKLGNWNHRIEGMFDLVVSNPPYVVRGELAQLAPELGFEPEVALNGGEDGLEAYRALAPVMARRVASEGLILLEIGAGQVEAVSGLLLAAELVVNHVAADLAGRPRVVVGGRNPKKVLETGR